jgi:hydrogenase maturation protease
MSEVTRIICIGSPHGDDRVGWQLAARLAERPELPAEVFSVAQPSLIWQYLPNCSQLIVVDALVAGEIPGTVVRWQWPEPRIIMPRQLSTHGMGLGAVLELAQQLGRLPPTVILFGLEIGYGTGNAISSDVLAKGLDELEFQVCREIGCPTVRNLH